MEEMGMGMDNEKDYNFSRFFAKQNKWQCVINWGALLA